MTHARHEDGEPDHSSGSRAEQPTYILTFDLGSKVQYLRQLGLGVPKPEDPFFAGVRTMLVQKFGECFPGSRVLGIDVPDLANEILSRALGKQKRLGSGCVVSTCMEIADARRGLTLEINRLVGEGGEIIGLGPRPGHPPLSTQIEGIEKMAAGEPIILVEDGSFTGSTIVHIVKAFQAKRVEIAAIVIGFAFEKAVANIREHFDGELNIVEPRGNYIDWMPDHDFFPFVPGCGRVMGVKWYDQCLPLYSHNESSYSIPYLISYCPMGKWTGISDHNRVIDLTAECLGKGIELFKMIESLSGGRKLTVNDLLGCNPRVSIPISDTAREFPSADTRVMDILVSTYEMYR